MRGAGAGASDGRLVVVFFAEIQAGFVSCYQARDICAMFVEDEQGDHDGTEGDAFGRRVAGGVEEVNKKRQCDCGGNRA